MSILKSWEKIMCGIVGTIGYDTDKYVKIMNNCQTHRGPDDEGNYFDVKSKVCIGMRRLSIIDLQNGHQPMHNEDSTIFIVFNGEIFNAELLRKELETDGHAFYTKNSDTEVLIHLYEKYGVNMLQYLNGMFAFALWDQKQRRLFIARDYAGNKPLYYAKLGNRLVFASELKCITKTRLVDETINMNSVSQYLSLQFIPAPNTIFNEINKLPAASYLLYNIDTNHIMIEKYWLPSFNTKSRSEKEWQSHIYNEFENAVNRWKISDVPVATSLSGGIDSISILAMLRKNSDEDIHTYTLGFTDAPECDEHIIAKKVSEYYHTKHHEILLTVDELLKDIDQMIFSLDEPYAGGLPSWYIYKEMSKGFKVGFSGIGGDELFGNYGKWKRYENIKDHSIRIVWELLNQETVSNLITYPRGSVYHKYMTEGMKNSIFEQKTLGSMNSEANVDLLYEKMISKCESNEWKNIVPWIDFQMQLPDEFLHMTDRFSMNFSVEARTPFLDKELIETVYSIPAKMRTKKSSLKYLFINAMRADLPAEIINAPKKGFVLPYKRWLKNDLFELVKDYTGCQYIKKQGIFSEKIQKKLINPYYNGNHYYTPLVWTILMFQLWYNKYQENKKNEKCE